MADVAQLVEPRFVVPVVVSSSLIVRPILKNLTILKIFIPVINALDAYDYLLDFYPLSA